MKLTLITFLIVAAASAQSFNFQISGGVAEVSETPQGASLFYSVGVGYALDSNFGITLKGRRSYFENAYPQDNYDVVGSYKIINNRVYHTLDHHSI